MRVLILFAVISLVAFGNLHPETTEVLTPEMNSALKMVLQVFTKLCNGDNGSLEMFSEMFWTINLNEYLTALKGVSITGQIAASYLKNLDNGTKNVIDNITKMENYIDSLKMDNNYLPGSTSINRKLHFTFFDQNVEVPVGAAMGTILLRRILNESDMKEEFLSIIAESNLVRAAFVIKDEAGSIQRNVSLETRFDFETFNQYRGNILKQFLLSNVVQYYAAGVELNGTEFELQKDCLDDFFTENYNSLVTTFQEEFDFFDKHYIPGFLMEENVQPMIDIGGENCKIAQNIVTNISSKYPWHNYAVIVSESVNEKDEYAYFDLSNKTLMGEYKGKTVFVLTATGKFTQQKADYTENFIKDGITSSAREIFDSSNLNSVLDYAKISNMVPQMVVYNKNSDPCLRADSPAVSDFFEVDNLHYWKFIIPRKATLSFAVIF